MGDDRPPSSGPLFYRRTAPTTSPSIPFTRPSPDAWAQSAHGLPSGLPVSTRHASSPPSFISLPTSASPTSLSPPRRPAPLPPLWQAGPTGHPLSLPPPLAGRQGAEGPPLPHPPPRRPPPIWRGRSGSPPRVDRPVLFVLGFRATHCSSWPLGGRRRDLDLAGPAALVPLDLGRRIRGLCPARELARGDEGPWPRAFSPRTGGSRSLFHSLQSFFFRSELCWFNSGCTPVSACIVSVASYGMFRAIQHWFVCACGSSMQLLFQLVLGVWMIVFV
jgi:hypothetical protein